MPAKKSTRKTARKGTRTAAKKGTRASAAKKSGRKTTARKTTARKTTARKSAAKKSTARKSSGRKAGPRKFGKKASKKVGRAMHEFKHGELKSGKGGAGGPVKSREQAIAIGISEARAEGDKVPKQPAAKRGGRKKAA